MLTDTGIFKQYHIFFPLSSVRDEVHDLPLESGLCDFDFLTSEKDALLISRPRSQEIVHSYFLLLEHLLLDTTAII